MSPPKINMLTGGPFRPNFRVGTAAAPAGVFVTESSAAFAAGNNAAPTGASRAFRKKFRREQFGVDMVVYAK